MTTDTDNTTPPGVPNYFGIEREHPMLSIPCVIKIGNRRYVGQRVSITQLDVAQDIDDLEHGSKALARIEFPFENFAITLTAELTPAEGDPRTFLFSDPTGEHLPQLRYIINNVIAGDLTTLKGALSYSGPTQPKTPNPKQETSLGERIRSLGVFAVSLALAVTATVVVFTRYTTSYELYPVFIEEAGLKMQATVAGQITLLNPDAQPGEVIYAIAANTGDILSMRMPRAGEIKVATNIYEGATVLPTDLILTVLEPIAETRLTTLISIEGLTRALEGDPVTVDLPDGREVPAKVILRETTRAAALSGDLFVPVDLEVERTRLTARDTSMTGRLKVSKTFMGALGYGQE